MSLLETITKASSKIPTLPDQHSQYPIVLNPDPIFLNLKPQTNDEPQAQNPVKKVTGWEISETDAQLIELGQKFFKKLRRNLKNTNSFSKVEFLEMLTSYLEKLGQKVGKLVHFDKPEEVSVYKLVEKFGGFMGSDVKGLVLEGCISFEVWDVLESFISNSLIEHLFTSNLVSTFIGKRKSNLIVSCVKHSLDLQTYDLMCILKYFLVIPSDGYTSSLIVRNDWENQALLAIEKASDRDVSVKERNLAKEASLLLMLGYDGFSVSQLCLHYLFASNNLDEVIFSACVGKLNGEEIKSMVQYLAKWIMKYERFPHVGPCPKASSVLGLEVCDWVPSLENVVKCFSVVLDVHFSSLVLHSEFHELRLLEGVVSSLAGEARICCALASLSERLRFDNEVIVFAYLFMLSWKVYIMVTWNAERRHDFRTKSIDPEHGRIRDRDGFSGDS